MDAVQRRSFIETIVDFIRSVKMKLAGDGALLNSLNNLEKRYVKMLNAAIKENERAENRVVNKGGVSYSLGKSFGEQVDDVLNGNHNPRYDLYVSNTPQYLIDLNFSDDVLLMRNGKVKEILEKHPEMNAEIIKKIPSALKNPLLVLKSKTNPTVSVVVITDIMTSNGEMIIPVWVSQEGNYIDVDFSEKSAKTNFVASSYGRSSKGLIEYAVNNDGVLYQNPEIEKVRDLLARNGLQLPTPLKISNSVISVSDSSKNVKKNFSNSENNSENVEFDIPEGNGYNGYSMSNNAVNAYENGEMPLSKWTKADIISAVEEINPEIAKKLKVLNTDVLKEHLLVKTSWHHTSSRYNRTDFYSVSEAAVETVSDSDIEKWASKKPEKPQTNKYRGSIDYLTWEGTQKHPKAVKHTMEDVNIEERGSFYIVTDDDGNELLRKKIGSNGTHVTNYAARDLLESQERNRKAAYKNNSSKKAYDFYQSIGFKEYSTSGHIYESGRKPSRYDYERGLENFFKVGEQRLYNDTANSRYVLETWDGNNWVAENAGIDAVSFDIPDDDIDNFSAGDYNEIYINDRQEYSMVMSAIRSKDGEDFTPGRIQKVFAYDSSYLYYYDRNGKPIIVERHNSISTPKLEEYNNVNKTRGNIGSGLETSRGGYGLNKNGNVFSDNREITSTNGRVSRQSLSEQRRSDRAGYTESGNNSNSETQAELSDSAFSMPENTDFAIPDEESTENLRERAQKLTEQYDKGEISEEEYRNGMAEIWVEQGEKVGTIPEGENAKDDYGVPKKDLNGRKVRRFARTILEKGNLPQNAETELGREILLGDKFSYDAISDKKAKRAATAYFENGDAEETWTAQVNSENVPGKNIIAVLR